MINCQWCQKEFHRTRPWNIYCNPQCNIDRQNNNKEYKRNYYQKRREYYVALNVSNGRKRRYGLTEDTYQQMLQDQNSLCYICNEPETGYSRSKVKQLSVDHCHKTGKVRKLLCDRCNRGLGHFQDNVLLMEKAVRYLKDIA